ncbi:MAG TPA: hypothetical protein DCW72_09750 [Elusimicrobia bacterium]|nr:MAG: hypothetical protein A2X29_07235 [Elusimicrobia bacterium GWA2_64_40]HAN04383.1 hypothetical protein [Elusimicrobiota bacterium]HAU90474.1 hypothetical protein [Elusimicrobiota bacterium]
MDWYLSLVKAHPITSAMAQFAVLGTLGEVLSKWLLAGRIHSPFGLRGTLLRAAGWSALAVAIKYAFTGFVAFTDGLVAHGLLPALGAFGKAFAVSLAMNLQFGPFLVLAHRLIDNAIDGRPNWAGLDKGFKSLLWFWVPAHTLTFMLPVDLRIGLAAVWSLALGLILGWYNRPAKV